ncbi:MAG: alpha/beta-type small acid-soluble spore protein [Bacillota bacterium]|nr:alpha/beta-type small acid-soluble spore protein [Bacillota bacterium]
MSRRHGALVPKAQHAVDKLKEEVANEIGVDIPHSDDGRWGYVPAQRCGDVGGSMVKKMIESVEKSMVKNKN